MACRPLFTGLDKDDADVILLFVYPEGKAVIQNGNGLNLSLALATTIHTKKK